MSRTKVVVSRQLLTAIMRDNMTSGVRAATRCSSGNMAVDPLRPEAAVCHGNIATQVPQIVLRSANRIHEWDGSERALGKVATWRRAVPPGEP